MCAARASTARLKLSMLHLIAYDIGHPRRLRRVAKICANYGVRMEKSVFECDLTDEQIDRLIEWDQSENKEDTDGKKGNYTLEDSVWGENLLSYFARIVPR